MTAKQPAITLEDTVEQEKTSSAVTVKASKHLKKLKSSSYLGVNVHPRGEPKAFTGAGASEYNSVKPKIKHKLNANSLSLQLTEGPLDHKRKALLPWPLELTRLNNSSVQNKLINLVGQKPDQTNA
jgi:hypothetical protein